MKHRVCALLLGALLLSGSGALAQNTTYVFPYEGLRYTQDDSETVLTQTNLSEHEALIEALGTTKEAVLASYIAAGIVMEVIPDEGGQIALSVADAGEFSDVQQMEEITDVRLEAFLKQFEESGLYETCALTDTTPRCVRLTSSAMNAAMPVYTVRYATLHLGRLYMLTQVIVGREPDAQDDAQIEAVLSRVKLLSAVSEPTPTPTLAPTPTPEPTPVPTPGIAEVIAGEGEMTVEDVPAFTQSAELTLTGRTDPSAQVDVTLGEKKLATATAKKDGTFSVKVKLPEEGDLQLVVSSGQAYRTLAVRYEIPAAKLVITEPTETTFTGENVTIRGETEPNATVYVEGVDNNVNVKANKNGVFSVRIYMGAAGTETFTLRTKVSGFKESTASVTLTRELTERESFALFRQKMIALDYSTLAKNPAKYEGKLFQFRGKVMEFTDFDGSPCALVCVKNVATGVWRDPIWIVLGGDEEIAEGDVVTFYLMGEALTLPANGQYTADGKEVEAPVARMIFWSFNK